MELTKKKFNLKKKQKYKKKKIITFGFIGNFIERKGNL